MTIEITDSNFEDVVTQSNLPVVIDFWAEWCPPCKEMAGSMENLSKKYEGKVLVGKVDVDYNSVISTKFGIRNIPVILFLVNGKVVDKHVGLASPSQLESKLDKVLEKQIDFGMTNF
jgi:thioredoxin 1